MQKERRRILISVAAAALLLSGNVMADQTINGDENQTVYYHTGENVTVQGSIHLDENDNNAIIANIELNQSDSGIAEGQTILNEGLLENNSTAKGVAGILNGFEDDTLPSPDNNGTITNNGTISIHAEARYAVGIYAGNNHGIIGTGSDSTITVNASKTDDSVEADGITASSNNGTITNNGILAVNADKGNAGQYQYAKAIGILVDDGNSGNISNAGILTASATSPINNYYLYAQSRGISIGDISDGNITNSASLRSDASGFTAKADGIALDESNNGTIINSSIIAVHAQGAKIYNYSKYGPSSSGSSRAIGVNINRNNNGSIINEGNISVSSDAFEARATGVNVDNTNIGTITNSGTITALSRGEGSESYGYTNWANARGLSINGNTGIVVNEETGTIKADAAGYTTTAVAMVDTYNNDANITNSGVMTAIADASKKNASSTGIVLSGDNSGNIITSESGKIIAESISENDGANASGIIIRQGNSGNLYNLGTISSTAQGKGHAEATGISIYTSDGAIINSQTIDVNASSESYAHAKGISVGNDNKGDILNSGTLTASSATQHSLARSDGIYIGDNYGNIVNADTATITATSSAQAGGTAWANGIYLSGANVDGNITNRGAIIASAAGDSAHAYGMYMWSNYGDGDISNLAGGTISATATATDSGGGAGAFGIYVGGDNQGSLLNAGSVTATATANSAAAYGIQIDGTNSGDLNNSGSIVATANGGNDPAEAYGLYINTNEAEIVNSGDVTATATGDHPKAYSLYIGNGNAGSAFHNTATGTMNGSIYAPDTDVLNEGTINLGLSPSRAGSFYQTAGGTLGVQVAMLDGNVSDHSLLTVDGTATFADGTHLFVDVTGDGSTLAQESNITVVSAGTLEVNASTLALSDNSALLDFQAFADSQDLNLSVSANHSIEEAVRNSDNYGSEDAGRALDEIADSGSGGMNDLLGMLYTLGSDEEVGRAVASASPVGTASLPMAASSMLATLRNTVGQRMGGGGLNSGGDILPATMTRSGYELWIKPYAGKAKQDNKDGLLGFDLHTSGIGFGADREFGDASRFGFAFFYSRGNVDVNDIDQSEDIDLYTLMAYGQTRFLLNRPTTLYWEASYSWQNIHSSRTEWPSGDLYSASFDGSALTLDARLEQRYDLSAEWAGYLSLFGRYGHYETDAYTESGPNPANALSVGKAEYDRFILGSGVRLDYALGEHSHLLLGGELGYNLGDRGVTVTAAWGGAPDTHFQTDSIKNGRAVYNLGLGYKYQNDAFTFSIGYRYDGEGSDYNAHSVGAKFSYKF